jgi:peptidoglycan/xylan/chitin deacetylase (PgdA/CDA1 family)
VNYDLACTQLDERQRAFDRLYWPVRTLPEHEQRKWIRKVTSEHGIDLNAMCREVAMSWEELRRISAHPLCTIGAHTVNHFALAKLGETEARDEIASSRKRLQDELQCPVDFFAYPYGDEGSAGSREFSLTASLGFKAAVTTRKDLIHNAHCRHMSALPRVALNGSFQKIRYVDVLLSGAPFALWNVLRPASVS